ncbi:hypothetical protein [Morganella sp. GD04133]|uniref:hypothetical protein n=1 Tax=Morganella sp. GD04133 TaxID=2975435 RepID=UPI0024485242|nr:hypothetical protein [Morganella sp. GD04133]MDH0356516.1 hypothetical protein [Morganella sp. GD04133]
MDITFECNSFSGVTRRSTGKIVIEADGAVLDGHVDISDIVEEYSANALLSEIEDEDIIKYLTEQGYVVTEP